LVPPASEAVWLRPKAEASTCVHTSSGLVVKLPLRTEVVRRRQRGVLPRVGEAVAEADDGGEFLRLRGTDTGEGERERADELLGTRHLVGSPG
jgi:hypothetical protein